MFRRLGRAAVCICAFFVLCTSAALAAVPAGSLFAVPKTGMDGVEHWGYMNENGKIVIDCTYSAAEPFDASGVAAVYNDSGEAALIDAQGENLTGWQRAPQSVAYENGVAAFRYADRTVYFHANGSRIGEYAGAVGFPMDGRVCVRTGEGTQTRYGYVDLEGTSVIAPVYLEAGQFSGGQALVRDLQNNCHLIGTDGREVAALPPGTDPAALEIYEDGVIILRNSAKQYALYSVKEKRFLASYSYQEIKPFTGSRAMIRVGTNWGLMDTTGTEVLAPTYPYMSYLGSGLYVVRGVDAGASVLNEDGAVVYRTETYAGGFEGFQYGISWHGTMEGDIIFFNASGSLKKKVTGIENPQIVAATVACVQRNGKTQFINMYNGRVLYENVREYRLEGGIKVTTEVYEKYLGMNDDGTEYGWYIEYPMLSGMKNDAVQTRINNTLREFFTAGPSGETSRTALRATYGFSLENQVLVVWASGTSDAGQAVAGWNSSIGIDLVTGARYTAERDLFNEKMLEVTAKLLPQTIPYYGSPRMDKDGVTFFRSHTTAGTAQPYAESLHLTFDQLAEAIRLDGACYRALTGFSGTVYADVPYQHWAFPYVAEAARLGLMTGDENGFQPDAFLRTCEAAAAIARGLKLPEGTMPRLDQSKWYAAEIGAIYETGLLEGFDTYWLNPEAVMTRADAMQLLANVLAYQKRDGGDMDSQEVVQHLSRFPDFEQIPENRRRAAAICVRAHLLQGDENGLRPADAFTRAEFAKILLSIVKK